MVDLILLAIIIVFNTFYTWLNLFIGVNVGPVRCCKVCLCSLDLSLGSLELLRVAGFAAGRGAALVAAADVAVFEARVLKVSFIASDRKARDHRLLLVRNRLNSKECAAFLQ